MKCSICGAENFREGKQCHKECKVVCMKCCQKCKYHCYEESMYLKICSYPYIIKKE
nr:MAG TPA: antitoxin [Caudoviricetes sp.]